MLLNSYFLIPIWAISGSVFTIFFFLMTKEDVFLFIARSNKLLLCNILYMILNSGFNEFSQKHVNFCSSRQISSSIWLETKWILILYNMYNMFHAETY